MLSIQHLTKTVTTDWMKKKTLLHDISLTIPDGSIYALLWPNGAGKTTLIKCIMGFMKTKNWHIDTSVDHIGYSPDTTQLFTYLTGYEQMKLVWDLHRKRTWKDVKGREKTWKGTIASLLEKVGLDANNATRVANYSAGMKKRLWLAMSLINDPEFLIRDEPMAGVDPLGRITIRNLIHELKSQGKTLLFSTHILSDVEEVADHIAIIHHGHILHESPRDDITGDLEPFFSQIVQK